MDDAFFEGFHRDLHDAARWDAFYRAQQARDPGLPREVPPAPTLNARGLFLEMMTSSTAPDPWMYPALRRLRDSGRYVLAAVSNTVIFPPGHALHQPDFFSGPVRGLFDVFVSSAHVGLRKPDPRMYEYTLREIDRHVRQAGTAEGVRPEEVVFLDDIGENLKAARKMGIRTIKVNLGRAFEAVDQLEEVTGLKLAGDHPRIPIKPKYDKPKAKI